MDSLNQPAMNEAMRNSCKTGCAEGPGYATPLDAMRGPREKLLYIPCVYTGTGRGKPDYLATIDCNPDSSNYGKVSLMQPWLVTRAKTSM